MFHAFTSLFFESAAFVIFATCLFWAVAGVVAADHTGRSRLSGALIGGLLPMIGWAILLVPQRRHQEAEAYGAMPPPQPLVMPEFGGTPGSMSYIPVGGSYGQDVDVMGGGSSGQGRVLAKPSPLVTAVGILAIVLLLSAYFEAWLNVGVTVTSDSYAGGDSLFTAVPLGIGITLLGLAVGLQIVKPHGVWCMAGALAGTMSLLLGTQVWLFTHAVSSFLSHAGSLVHSKEETTAGLGATSLAVGGIAALVWVLLSLSRTEPAS
jgi:hypothetical protein